MIRYQFNLNLLKMRFKLSDEETLLSSNKKQQLLLECVVCLLHPQYLLHNVELHAYNSIVDIYTVSKWNDVMTVASMARVVLICSFAITMTGVSSNRAKRIALMHGYEQDYTNIIKTLTKESPFKAVILASLVSIPLFAFCLRICERYSELNRPLTDTTGDQPFGYLSSAMWVVVVTMMTGSSQ